jgi:hypothetical protein
MQMNASVDDTAGGGARTSATGEGRRNTSPYSCEGIWDLLGPKRRRLLWIMLCWKIALFLVALCAVELFPSFNLNEYHNDIHWPRSEEPVLATHFATWDGAHYLFLSEVGYQTGSASCAFYPLWPWLIRAGSYLTFHNHFAAGLLLANVLSLVDCCFFHYLIEQYHGLETANRSVALIVAFPSAIFFSLIYSESLFFLLIILFFLGLFKENYFLVAITGFLLPLTKAVGIFCLAPLAVHLWRTTATPKAWRAFATFYAIVLGYACYFLFMYYATASPFEGFDAQRFYPNHPSIAHIFDVQGFFRALFMPLQLHGMYDSALDRALFLLLLGCLYPIYKLKKEYLAYALLVGTVPALSSWFLSYSRNVMMCFPVFIVLGQFFANKNRRFLFWWILVVMGTFQIWFLLRYINFIWVA